jgi:hypothetical protein
MGFYPIITAFGQPITISQSVDIKTEKQKVGELGQHFKLDNNLPKWLVDKKSKVKPSLISQMNQTQLHFLLEVNIAGLRTGEPHVNITDHGLPVNGQSTTTVTVDVSKQGRASISLYRYYTDSQAYWSLTPIDGKTTVMIVL